MGPWRRRRGLSSIELLCYLLLQIGLIVEWPELIVHGRALLRWVEPLRATGEVTTQPCRPFQVQKQAVLWMLLSGGATIHAAGPSAAMVASSGAAWWMRRIESALLLF